MKTFLLILVVVITFSYRSNAQEFKVEIVPDSLFHPTKKNETNRVLICSYQGVPFEIVASDYFLPFNLFEFSVDEENWWNIESVYNTIRAKVPNVSITVTSNPQAVPNIRMRGDDNTIVIIDGIRSDASILNSLNPADIENIKVATGPAATNYLINN